MPIDASIPLSYRPNVEAITPTQLLSLKDLSLRTQMDEQEVQRKQAIGQVLKAPGAIDPQTGRPTLATIGQISTFDPKMGHDLAQLNRQFELEQFKVTKEKEAFLTNFGTAYVSRYDQLAAKMPPADADRQARQETVDALKAADANGTLRTVYRMSDTEVSRAMNLPPVNQVRQSVIMAGGSLPKAPSTDTAKEPPSGYRWKGGNLEFIPGGPADPDKKTGSLGNRESVFINRVMLSANEAAKDLENVVRLPTTASRGLFGGRQQGPGLLDAGKETLANKMTSQEVQSYNVRSAGFQRSLAAIEAAGLAPSGTLSHQMDAVIFKEGDTNHTKLEKLAQTRQIVEAGLETTLSNPKLAKAQKDHIEEVIKSIRKAVPFTLEDLDRLAAAQEDNPATTLRDIMPKAEKPKIGPYDDAEKEKRYQEWKAKQGG